MTTVTAFSVRPGAPAAKPLEICTRNARRLRALLTTGRRGRSSSGDFDTSPGVGR